MRSTPPFSLPTDYARLRVVGSFHELVTTPMTNGVNALCWPRTLAGDFEEVAARIGGDEPITALDEDLLCALPLSAAGRAAVEIMLGDQRQLLTHGLAPELNCIRAYPRDEDPGAVPIDVYSFHADSATVAADTFLCSYTESSSEGLRNEEAIRRVDLPETRAALLAHYGGADDAGFREYLSEHCYDLHYAALPEARPFSFGLGNFWRIAVDYPGNPVPPCVHRAPDTVPGRPPRLLLIS